MSAMNMTIHAALELARRLGCRVDGPGNDGSARVLAPPGVRDMRWVKTRLGHAMADRPFVRQLLRWQREKGMALGAGFAVREAGPRGQQVWRHVNGVDGLGRGAEMTWKNSKIEDARRALQRLRGR